jgi:hypothetical protein
VHVLPLTTPGAISWVGINDEGHKRTWLSTATNNNTTRTTSTTPPQHQQHSNLVTSSLKGGAASHTHWAKKKLLLVFVYITNTATLNNRIIIPHHVVDCGDSIIYWQLRPLLLLLSPWQGYLPTPIVTYCLTTNRLNECPSV